MANNSENIIHRYSKIKTVYGFFWIAWSPRGITAIRPVEGTMNAFETAYEKRIGTRPRIGEIPDAYRRVLQGALQGQAAPPECIDWTYFTNFQRKVLKRLLQIPAGTVRTYSWLAGRAGNPTAARAVGNVMARNPIPFVLPCHRIVPASGGVGNYGLGKGLKQKLLSQEGAVLK